MRGLPVNIVNLICEWAADAEQEWIPFFCPKTHKLSYKVNKNSIKFIENADIILHNRFDSYLIEGQVNINFLERGLYLVDTYSTYFKGILFQYGKNEFKIYTEFDSEKDESKKGKHIYRTMTYFQGTPEGGDMINYLGKCPNLYLNGTISSLVLEAYYDYNLSQLNLSIENF